MDRLCVETDRGRAPEQRLTAQANSEQVETVRYAASGCKGTHARAVVTAVFDLVDSPLFFVL
eukprot:SAG11_NODE_459_length_9261_cov_7.747463_8_plen_62_part_00